MEPDEEFDLSRLFVILRLAFFVTFTGMFTLALAAGVWVPAAILFFYEFPRDVIINAIGLGTIYMITSQVIACLLIAFFPWDRGLEKLVDRIACLSEDDEF